jgi:hypothetical protein
MRQLIGGVIMAALASACAERVTEPPEFGRFADAAAFARVGPPHVCCYEDGRILRTVVPPSAFPNQGRDPIYAFASGVEGQLPVAAAGPGDGDYHGGAWAVHSVTWNVAPYLITSDERLLAAAAEGDVTITRIPENDFRCPVQP